ncbi:MAG: TonB-dependent receptor [Planctomycetota bacterium]
MTHRCVTTLVIAAATAVSTGTIRAQDPAARQEPEQSVELPSEEVSAERQKAFTLKSATEAEQQLRLVPGAATLIREDEYRYRRVADISDVLRLSPAVYIQSRYGGSETRLSVRGSGIRQTFNAIGVRILRNGIPLSEADSNVRPQLIEPLNVQYTEVLPGANGLLYGASTLGGAINFVTPTGYTADEGRMRIEIGSDDYTRAQVSSGRVLDGGFDYFVSGTVIDRDGFRVNSEERAERIYGNIGYRISDTWETRLHLSGQESDLLLPGSLTKAALKTNVRQANGAFLNVRSRRQFDLVRVDWQTTGKFDDGSQLDLALSTQFLEMDHPLPFPFSTGGGRLTQRRFDYTASARYHGDADWFGTENQFVIGALAAIGNDDSKRFRIDNGQLDRDREAESITAEIYMQDIVSLNDTLQAVAGLHIGLARRDFQTQFGTGITADEDYFGLNPKVGLIYEPRDDLQFFTNVSRSFEPPTDGGIQNSIGATLDDQTAWTVELGSRGESGNTSWNAAVYHSWVSDELLSVETPPASGNFETGNADTTHFGVEIGLQQTIPLDWLSNSDDGRVDNFFARATYTFNQFEFDGDSTFGDNDIPGIPQHVFRGEIGYQNPQGFYASLILDGASSWNVDFANSFEANGFLILGAAAGYDTGKWRFFVDAQNLENERYASNTSIVTNAMGMDTNVFNPGLPFSLFVGTELTL